MVKIICYCCSYVYLKCYTLNFVRFMSELNVFFIIFNFILCRMNTVHYIILDAICFIRPTVTVLKKVYVLDLHNVRNY